MKKIASLSLTFLLAVLMVLSLVACGTPAETTAQETTKAETTAAKTKAETTKAVTTKVTTTKAVTTEEPYVDPEPELAAKEHTEHLWYSVPTFTPYAEKKANGTIGELATRCRYAGCTAVKEGNPQPTLVWLDFTAEDKVTIANYLSTQQNVALFSRSTSLTSGLIKNNAWSCSSSSQVMLEETVGIYKNFEKFTISYDAQIGATTGKTGFMGYVFYGTDTISTYFFQLRTSETGTLQVCRSTTTGLDMEGIVLKVNGWYHFDYDVVLYPENPTVSTLNVYMAEWETDSAGRRTVLGERVYVGALTGLPVDAATADEIKEGTAKTNLNDYLDTLHKADINASGFRISNANAVKTLDNLAITIPYVDETHTHTFGTAETVTFETVKEGYTGYTFAKCTGKDCDVCQVIGIKEGGIQEAAVETDYACKAVDCGCRLGIVTETPVACLIDGTVTTTCVKCGTPFVTIVKEKLGHDLQPVSTVAAACGVNGYKVVKCTRCPEEQKEWTDPMTSAHKFTTKVYTAYETAQTNNAIGYYTSTCAICGGVYKEEVFVKLDFNTEGGATAGTLLDYLASQKNVIGYKSASSATGTTGLGEVINNVYNFASSQTLIEFDSNNDKKYIDATEPDWFIAGQDYVKLSADVKFSAETGVSAVLMLLGSAGSDSFGGVGQVYIAEGGKLGVAGNTASKNSIFVSDYTITPGKWYHIDLIFEDVDNSNLEKAITVWIGAYDENEGDNFKTLTEMVNIGTFRSGLGSIPAAASSKKYFNAVKLAQKAVTSMDNFEVVIASTKTN